MTNTRKTNKEFAANDKNFLERCKAAKFEPTKRFKLGKGE